MNPPDPSQIPRRKWRWISLLFLSLLPLVALFHIVMWFGFTRTLFRIETGDLKRIGYLVGVENGKARLQKNDSTSGFTILAGEKLANAKQVSTVVFGDSFSSSLAQAYSLKRGEPVGLAAVDWEQGNGFAQLKRWLADDWFRAHGVKSIVVERVEYAWIDTFASEGDSSLTIPWNDALAGHTPQPYEKARQWTFANNGNFKVLFANISYCFSPTAFNLTDTCVVKLDRPFFSGSDGNRLLFYRGDFKGALNEKSRPRLEQALQNIQELSELGHRQGLTIYFIVPPVKSYLYYDWVEHPFYPDSKLLETLRERASANGYVDLKQLFHAKLAEGYQDLYYPDDAHWNFPAAQMAAEELMKIEEKQ
jgi:hypothetical protein